MSAKYVFSFVKRTLIKITSIRMTSGSVIDDIMDFIFCLAVELGQFFNNKNIGSEFNLSEGFTDSSHG